ncbi:S8 family serine peptidase [Marinimicrobium sp. C2-29]|uniref:S8 family serine peptidase n=1 Tax=Marinimicrobium sp. C2-29 TaxID=3139825 RepID=UPI003138CB6D
MDNRIRFFGFFFSIIFSGYLSLPAVASSGEPYIVQFNDSYLGKTEIAKELLQSNFQTRAQALGTRSKISFTHTYRHVIAGAVVKLTEDEANYVKGLDFVHHLEKDGASYPDQGWGRDRINQRDLPLDNNFSTTHDGMGATIFVVDTGIDDSHDEFYGRIVESMGVGSVSGGDDCQGHGTRVSSIAAGASVGVASGADIYSIRISGDCADGTADHADMISAFDHIRSRITQDSPTHPIIDNAVVNFSYSPTSAAVEQSVESLIRAGAVVVTSAGNDDENACGQAMPPSALVVGATNDSDERWVRFTQGSNYGVCVSLLAPGDEVPVADLGDDDGYIHRTGTSYSSPYVAGIAATYLERFPGANNMEVKEAIIDGASQGKLTNLNNSPNLLAYTEIDQPDSYWQQAGMTTIPGPASSFYPKPGCDLNDHAFTAVGSSGSQTIVIRWICM